MATSDSTRRFTEVAVMLRVNGSARRLQLDSRVTLLDATGAVLTGCRPSNASSDRETNTRGLSFDEDALSGNPRC